MALPHDGVWARLGVSSIHGIGVFALHDVSAGTDLFPGDDAEIRWVDRAELEVASDAERKLYTDFGIGDGDRIGVPASFNLLTPGWYLNEPPAGMAANVIATADYRLLAARDISEGEELTVDYETFSSTAPAPASPR